MFWLSIRITEPNRSPAHMILWRDYHFLSFKCGPQIFSVLLYVTHKSWVTFVRRCFFDVFGQIDLNKLWAWKYNFWYSFGEIKIDLTPKKSNILYLTCIWAATWENRIFAYAKTKTQISFAVTAKLISAFVFATWIVQSLCFLNPKFQVSSHLLWLYSPVSVGPGRKPRRPVFSRRGSDTSEIEDIWFFRCKIDFYFTEWTTKSCIFTSGEATSENTAFGVHEVK